MNRYYTIRKSGALIVVSPALGRMVIHRNSGRMRVLKVGRHVCERFAQFPFNAKNRKYLKELYGFSALWF